MARLLALAGMLLGLISCQPEIVLPGGSSTPVVPSPRTPEPGGPSPSIEIPPPI
jgi:hypothetical protein